MLTPEVAANSAACYGRRVDGHNAAVRLDWEVLTRKINGGLNGHKERVAFIERVLRVLDAQ